MGAAPLRPGEAALGEARLVVAGEGDRAEEQVRHAVQLADEAAQAGQGHEGVVVGAGDVGDAAAGLQEAQGGVAPPRPHLGHVEEAPAITDASHGQHIAAGCILRRKGSALRRAEPFAAHDKADKRRLSVRPQLPGAADCVASWSTARRALHANHQPSRAPQASRAVHAPPAPGLRLLPGTLGDCRRRADPLERFEPQYVVLDHRLVQFGGVPGVGAQQCVCAGVGALPNACYRSHATVVTTRLAARRVEPPTAVALAERSLAADAPRRAGAVRSHRGGASSFR